MNDVRRARRLTLLGPLLLGLAACGVTDLDSDPEAPIRTSRSEYVLRESGDGATLEARIPYRYENRTDAPICMTHCMGLFSIRLEKLVAGEWRFAWAPAIPECLSRPPITIEPGGSHRDTLTVVHSTDRDAYPRIDADEFEGVYRLAIPAASRLRSPEQCGGRPVPEGQRASNRFRLTRE